MCKVSINFDTARITKATFTVIVTLKVVRFFMTISLKNVATTALSDYVKNMIALWWLLDYMYEYSFAKKRVQTHLLTTLTECSPTLRDRFSVRVRSVGAERVFLLSLSNS